ncbi:MAG: hypothetical protein AAB774_01285 [Patescibacteria group bacterium]
MNISINSHEVSFTEGWLREQLLKLESFKYSADGVIYSRICLYDRYDEESSWFGYNVVFVVTDETCDCENDYVTYQQVLFENGGVAFIVPNLPPEGLVNSHGVIRPSREGGGDRFEDYRSIWTKGTWMDGIAALAKSVASRSFGIGSEESQRVGQLLDELGSIAPKLAEVTVSP